MPLLSDHEKGCICEWCLATKKIKSNVRDHLVPPPPDRLEKTTPPKLPKRLVKVKKTGVQDSFLQRVKRNHEDLARDRYRA